MNLSDYPVTMTLIALNVVSSLIGFNNNNWMNKAIMWPYVVKRKGEYFRFISSGFLHADWGHLFFNMFTLFFFGINIEIIFSYYNLGGIASYIVLYVAGLIVSDIPSYFKHNNNPGYRSLGASGAVSAILFAAIIFDPWSSVYIYGALRLSALLFAVLYIAYCVYMSKNGGDNINHDAHLWGALFGLTFTLALVAVKNPSTFEDILEKLKHPSLFGHG